MDAGSKGALSVREIAQALELDVKTVYAAARRGEIPTIVVGRRILVPARWLNDKLSGRV